MDVFLQPKTELDASPPRAVGASTARPKFEPKVKPRGKARAPTKQQSQDQQQPKAQQSKPPFPVKSEPSDISAHLHVALDESSASLSDTRPADIKPKLEPPADSSFSMLPDVSMKLEDGEEVLKSIPVKKEEPDSLPGSPSHVETEGDTVVREIDVYLCPNINAETKLYFLQYPLRPHWRPYGLEERCDSVRVKPKLKKLELDLIVDTEGENYDQDADEHLKIQKQTLSSSKIALTTNYAVGLLRGNKLHLAPLDAIVQLRPSMKYLDEADKRKKSAKKVIEDEEMADAVDEDEEDEKEDKPHLVALKVEVKKQETERQEQMRLQSHAYLKQLDEAEPWVPLETHGIDSPITEGIRLILTSKPDTNIPFAMPMSQYVSHIVPGRASSSTFEVATQDANANEGLSRSFLDTLPLEQRFEKLLSKGRVQVLQFERLMKLAPAGCSEEEVLSVLEDMAHLVQGCWVAASSLRYSGQICILRDYMLSLFTKNRVIRHDQLEELKVPKEMIREVLLPLAVQRPAEGGWEFQESTDRSFLKRHQIVAKEQMQRWAENDEQIKLAALGLKIGPSSGSNSVLPVADLPSQQQVLAHGKVATAVGSSGGRSKAPGGFSGEWTMSAETRAALPAALREIFAKHNVCSLQLICRSLLESAVAKASAPNANPRVVAAAAAAAQGTKAPLPELTAAISQVASNIDGLYFLTKLGNPTLDPFRDVVIALLRAKGASIGLKRIDIIEASKIALKTEVQQIVYQKVMRELCYTKSGTWLLKPGDGRPSPT
ncbi:hypothetical protein GOP47_0008371 [Adiantum capillus-veneris]|uniref:DNA-directed RNA polymerase III subunit RPC5 n=1 Tax=Adiantum capillus-veneris TaxID=13818 RepID=A0A9D4UY98_ADICA|nr:hypothetical protein GOP47_0008371 [Adiantum capillus-veneris]